MPRKSDPSYKTENSVFAARLREIMKERGENQTTLADKITSQYVTIQRQTISLYMNGQSKPDTERLTAIAKVLKVSADWLLGLTNDKGEHATATEALGLSHEAIMQIKHFGHDEKEIFDDVITHPVFCDLLCALTMIYDGALLHCAGKLSSQIEHNALEEVEIYVRKKLGVNDAIIIYGDWLTDLLAFKASGMLNEIISDLIKFGQIDAENYNK